MILVPLLWAHPKLEDSMQLWYEIFFFPIPYMGWKKKKKN